MFETILVGVLVAGAAVFTARKLFRPHARDAAEDGGASAGGCCAGCPSNDSGGCAVGSVVRREGGTHAEESRPHP